jgi:hypothetical protein
MQDRIHKNHKVPKGPKQLPNEIGRSGEKFMPGDAKYHGSETSWVNKLPFEKKGK